MTILLWFSSMILLGLGAVVGLAAAQITACLVALNSFEWPVLIIWIVAVALVCAGIYLMPITVVVVTA